MIFTLKRAIAVIVETFEEQQMTCLRPKSQFDAVLLF
jgi:hypothetical protein